MLLPTGTPALSTGLGNNHALTKAMGTGSNISKATKDALLNPVDPPATITGRAFTWLAAWLRAATPAQRALFSTSYVYFFPATESCLFKGNGYLLMQVGAPSGTSSRSCIYPAKEGFKDIAKTAKAEVFKATSG